MIRNKFLQLALLLFLQMCSVGVYSQTNLPEGVYTSLGGLVLGSPSQFYDSISVIERSSGDIVMAGGNNYKIVCEALSKKEIRKTWFAYSDGKELYINCFLLDLQNHFAKVRLMGSYILFDAAMSNSKASSTAFMFGAVGGAVTANNRYTYVLNCESGSVMLLNKKNMKSLLANDQQLLSSFMNESEVDDYVLVRYIKALNNVSPINLESLNRSMRPKPRQVDLILYRKNRKEKEQAFTVIIADSISKEFEPNSFLRLKLTYISEPIEVCNNDKSNCISLDFSVSPTYYINCSMTEKEPEILFEIVDANTGEWESKLAWNAQQKRERKALQTE